MPEQSARPQSQTSEAPTTPSPQTSLVVGSFSRQLCRFVSLAKVENSPSVHEENPGNGSQVEHGTKADMMLVPLEHPMSPSWLNRKLWPISCATTTEVPLVVLSAVVTPALNVALHMVSTQASPTVEPWNPPPSRTCRLSCSGRVRLSLLVMLVSNVLADTSSLPSGVGVNGSEAALV